MVICVGVWLFFSIRKSYTWDIKVRGVVPPTWVLYRETRIADLMRPWEWFNSPVSSLDYIVGIKKLEGVGEVIQHVIFKDADPFEDCPTVDNSPYIFAEIVSFQKKNRMFIGEINIAGKSDTDFREQMRGKEWESLTDDEFDTLINAQGNFIQNRVLFE